MPLSAKISFMCSNTRCEVGQGTHRLFPSKEVLVPLLGRDYSIQRSSAKVLAEVDSNSLSDSAPPSGLAVSSPDYDCALKDTHL